MSAPAPHRAKGPLARVKREDVPMPRRIPAGTPSPRKRARTAAGTDGDEASSVNTAAAWRARFDQVCAALNADAALREHGWRLFLGINTNHPLARKGHEDLLGDESVEDELKKRLLCSLWVGGQLAAPKSVTGQETVGSGISWTQLLKVTDTTAVDFFRCFRDFKQKFHDLPADLESRVSDMERRFVCVTILFRKFEALFDELFLPTAPAPARGSDADTPPGSPGSPAVSDVLHGADSVLREHIKEFCWALFVTVKVTTLGMRSTDLVSSYQLLICVVHFVLLHSPTALRVAQFRDAAVPAGEAADARKDAAGSVNLLAYLCNVTGVGVNALVNFHTNLQTTVRRWVDRGTLKCGRSKRGGGGGGGGGGVDDVAGRSPTSVAPGAATTSLAADIYPDLLTRNLGANLIAINKEYDVLLRTSRSGDLDERLFFAHDVVVGTPHNLTPMPKQRGSAYYRAGGGSVTLGSSTPDPTRTPQGPATYLMSPLRGAAALNSSSGSGGSGSGASSSSPAGSRSPFATPAPPTPVSSRVQAMRWLHDHVATEPRGPCDELRAVFVTAGDADASFIDAVDTRIWELARLCFPRSERTPSEEVTLQEPRTLGVKLYYRVLHHMLAAEKARNADVELAPLLRNDVFHRSLAAACFEVIVYAFNATHIAFPAVLDRFGLEPFDFCKVIAGFLKNERSLPRCIRRHVCDVEEHILELLAWRVDSRLYTLLDQQASASNSSTSAGATSTTTASTASATADDADADEPRKKRRKVSGDHEKSGAGVNVHALDMFWRKLWFLAALRVRDLCTRLQLDNVTIRQVWTVLKHALTKQYALMKGRHIDQLVMCTTYAVCKVKQMKDVSFRSIIEAYKKQAQASQHVYRHVFMGEGERTVDVIVFYNRVYIPAMKVFVLRFSEQKVRAKKLAEQQAEAARCDAARASMKSKTTTTTTGASSSSSSSSSPAAAGVPLEELPAMAQSPSRVYGGCVVLSPHRPPAHAMTPRTKSLWAFGRSPSKELSAINRSVNRTRGEAPAPPDLEHGAKRRSVHLKKRYEELQRMHGV